MSYRLNESTEYAAAQPYIGQAAVEIHSAIRQLELLIEHLPGEKWKWVHTEARAAINTLEVARSQQMITRSEIVFAERGYR